ncbi:MAG: NUDIX domain-containing protein [Chitinophagaceae bacterium]
MKFNIRVYGILINSNNQILVSDEFIRGNFFTKFPGGGLELGEGTIDCLMREFKEETNLDVTIGEHIYTTDFYQQSAFNSQDQIISIYYYAYTKEPITLKTSQKPFDFFPEQIADKKTCAESFRWVNWDDLSESTVHLPIDKIVVNMLLNKRK